MGRSHNSFTTWVGHAAETKHDNNTTPEHYLWTSVLSKAAHDAIYGSDWREAKIAINWFKGMGVGFREVCGYAGKDPQYVHTKMIAPIARRETEMKMIRNGGRYYVKDSPKLPIQYHSYYRARKKRGPYKKKHVTGNSYYKAKRKNLKMALQGSKGGRPRLYVV